MELARKNMRKGMTMRKTAIDPPACFAADPQAISCVKVTVKSTGASWPSLTMKEDCKLFFGAE